MIERPKKVKFAIMIPEDLDKAIREKFNRRKGDLSKFAEAALRKELATVPCS